jgi:hypothetical protein
MQFEINTNALLNDLMNNGLNYNFFDKYKAKLIGFLFLFKYNQEFVIFNKYWFRVYNAYNLNIIIKDNRGISRIFCKQFYEYKNSKYNIILEIKFLKYKGIGYYN